MHPYLHKVMPGFSCFRGKLTGRLVLEVGLGASGPECQPVCGLLD